MQPLALPQVELGGEFGRRVTQIIEANVLAVDVEATFLEPFRKRQVERLYLGFGKFIDACVRLAAGSGDARVLALKKDVIARLLATQERDGYIGTMADPSLRVKTLWDLHENSYIIWALVSDHQYFGEAASLEAARRMADYLLGLFAADPSLRPETLGGVVTFWASNLGFDRALLALGRATGEPKYAGFVAQFLKLQEYDPETHCGPSTLANHAYSYLGHCLAQLDWHRCSGDPRLLRASLRAVDFLRRGDGLLITGSCSEAECWHDSQSGLQNTAETCTGTYLVRLMDSMLQLEGASIYGDIMERTIYNALFAATSPDGKRNRYFTPFDGERPYDQHGQRFCCANNNKRFLGDLAGWIYYRTPDGVAVNLYNSSAATVKLAQEATLRIEQQTGYPSSGDVLVRVDPSAALDFAVHLRIPRWCRDARLSVNGSAPQTVSGGQFFPVRRTWNAGDVIELKLPMTWRLIRGRRAQSGRAAILRGPLIFTLNPGRNPQFNAPAPLEPRQLFIHPHEIEPPAADSSVRPGGVCCTVKAWPQGEFWPHIERKPLLLSEFADAAGEAIYFLVPNANDPLLVDDELLDLPSAKA
jgi:hypothetical protein